LAGLIALDPQARRWASLHRGQHGLMIPIANVTGLHLVPDAMRRAEGVRRVREVAAEPESRRLLERETRPGSEVSGRRVIERFLNHGAVHYYHPAGSCKIGPTDRSRRGR
jgi:choline dehydrogenase-like flavoprotein